MYRHARTPSSVYTRKPAMQLCAFDRIIVLLWTSTVLPSSDVGPVRSPPHHAREVLVRETLRIVRVLRPVVADEVVRQLVAEGDPPVRHGFHRAVGAVHAARVQLLEVSQVAEDASISVESDCGTLLVREDVDGRDWEVEDGGAVYEESGERCDGALVVCVEGLRVGRVAGQEEFHALVEIANECKIVARAAVAVRR
jgi:hypothetical protein